MIKTKQVLIALAVIGANVLHNMPVHTSLAAEPDYTIKQGSIIFDSPSTSGGNYTSIVQGNTTDGGLSSTSYSGNEIIIRKGTYKNVYGAFNNSSGNATNNKVFVYGGEFTTGINGGNGSGNVTGNKVVIEEIFGNVTFSGWGIVGGSGQGSSSSATENEVTIKGGTFSSNNLQIYGGNSGGVNAKDNVVTIEGGTFTGTAMKIAGGRSDNASGSVANNKVVINGGTFEGTGTGKIVIKGGAGKDSGGSASLTNNSVEINGGIFTANISIIAAEGSATVSSTGNSITIKGTKTLDLSGATLMGYETNGGNNRTLNVERANVKVGGIKNFGTISFDLEGVSSDSVVLKMGTALDLSSWNVGNITVSGIILADGDYITLMKNVNGSYSATNIKVLNNELVYYTGTEPLQLKGDYTIKQGGVKGDSGTSGSYTITVQGNTDNGSLTVTGGSLSSTSYSNNEIIIRRGEYAPEVGNDAVAGAYNTTNDAISNNIVKIYDGTFKGVIYGGYSSSSGAVSGNKVNIYGGTLGEGSTINIYGGRSISNNATGNLTNIEGGIFAVKAFIRGGASNSGDATGNKLNIENGTFTMDANEFYGGYSNNGNVEGNSVTIEDGTFSGSIYGGYSGGGNAKDNIVTIEGGTFSDEFKLYGGQPGSGKTSSGNILNLKTKIGGKANEVKYFQTMNFTLPSNITNNGIMLETTNVTYHDTTIGVTAANGVKLNKDDVIYLIKADNTSTGSISNDGASVLDGAAIVKLDGNNLILTLLKDYGSSNEDQQKAPVEGIAAAVQTVNMSADLASGEGMKSLIAETAGGFTNTFGALTAGHSKYKTGSHVDVDGWGILVGAGKTKEWGNGEATSLGVFFEYGKGDFDTYNGNVHGDGNSKNQGIGFMMRHKMMNNTYYEGNIRFGKQETEWGESDIGSYDTDSRYYGISVGMGHIFPAGKNEIDVYGRYTYGHVGSSDARVGTKDYHFDSVKSHRVRIGGKYNFKQKNSNAKPFVGLAWEHEFKGESKASIAGVGEAPAPGMKGNTGIMEVGCDWNLGKKWTAGISADAYVGKRKGWDGMARIFYNF